MKIIQSGTIFSPEIGHPYSEEYVNNFNHAPNLVKLSKGKYMVAWFSGPWETHPFQRILISYFDHDRWTKPRIIQNTKGASDFDPAFVKSGNGIYLFYSTGRKFPTRLQGEKKGFLGTYYRFSSNFGQSWSKPCLFSEEYACKSNGLRLKNGHLLLPVYSTVSNRVGIFKSIDDGYSWKRYVIDPFTTSVAEPSLIEFTVGHIVMIARTKTGKLWLSESIDNGENWTMPFSTEIISYNTPVSLLMDDDSLLVCYNYGNARDKLCLSSTKSLSFHWDKSVVVDQIKDSGYPTKSAIHSSGSDCAVTYPSMINFDDSKIILAWTKYEINENEHKGEILYCIINSGKEFLNI